MNILFFLTPKENVSYVSETDSLRGVLEKMQDHGFSAVPLLSHDGKYIGTITEGDLLWATKAMHFPSEKEMEKIRIVSVKRSRDNQAVNVMANMEDLFEKVTNQNFVPVVDDKKVFIGIVTRKDVLLFLKKKLEEKTV